MSRFAEIINNATSSVMKSLRGDKLPKFDLSRYEPYTYKSYAKGGKVGSASARADGIAQRGKTKGTIVMCGGGYMKGKK